MKVDNSSITKKIGRPPGTLIHVGKYNNEKTKISTIDYNNDNLEIVNHQTIEDCFNYKNTSSVTWINISGLNDAESLKKLGAHYDLHPLLLEDVLNTNHRPKKETFDEYIFLTLKMIGISPDGYSIITEQVSFVLGNNWLISFQEREGDLFDDLRLRLKENKGIIRKQKSDYLLYSLVDTIVDNYYLVLEHFSDKILELEENVINHPDQNTLHNIQKLKKLLINYRKSVIPLREALLSLQKEDSKLIHSKTKRYISDVYEHVIYIIDGIETQRDMLSTIMDLYLSGISNNMNQVMKVLTIISTIFIPLTFIAGVYGMNFQFMPELSIKWAYPLVWTVMVGITVGMIIYFKKKKWL